MGHAEYVRALRARLPKEAFAPAPSRILVWLTHMLVVWGGIALGLASGELWVQLVLMPIIGHSMAGIVFLTHDLSHGSILRSARRRYPLEVLGWTTVYMPATMWRHIHHELHHRHTQTVRDCDRLPLASEWTPAARVYALSYPSRATPWWNVFVWTQVALYAVGNTLVSLRYGVDPNRPDSPYVYTYAPRAYARLCAESALLFGMRGLVFWLADFSVLTWLLLDFFPFLIGSAIMFGYIATNHGLNPLGETVDPVRASLSVSVPPLVDRLHSRFSFHTEHHLFPSMDPRWYPEVSRLLVETFPERYQRLPFWEAWRRLFQRSPYVPDEAVLPADAPDDARERAPAGAVSADPIAAA